MRNFLDRALDSYPDYPPGFRPGDVEARHPREENNFSHGFTQMNTDYLNARRGHSMILQQEWICLALTSGSA